jgi:hypothetical protein
MCQLRKRLGLSIAILPSTSRSLGGHTAGTNETFELKSLDGGEATKKRPAAVWRQTGDDSKGIRDAYRSKFIGYALPVGLQFLEWRSLQRRNCTP